MMKKLLENSMKMNCKKASQTGFRVEKLIKGKSDKLYLKLKKYNNLFDRWIYKKSNDINERIFF